MSTKSPQLFSYMSRTHTALLFAKSLRRAFFPKDIVEMSPKVFKDTKAAFGSLRVLRNYELVEHTPCGWKITPKGVAYLRKHAKASSDA
jgi:hypothetical protein